jgi:hypothetical protein
MTDIFMTEATLAEGRPEDSTQDAVLAIEKAI